jgi:hypothetical protein
MINLGEYMLNVKNKVMNTLKEEIECSKGHLLYLIDVHIFSKEDINLNTTTLAWPQKIKPVFEQNTELVEDCKARFEERLQGKSENITKELLKLNGRVKELEDLGEMKNIQQYTYEVRLVYTSVADPDHFDADPDPDPTSEKNLMRIRIRILLINLNLLPN